MKIAPMYQHRWAELMTIALVLSVISLLINVENPAGLVIVTSLASTALGLMVAPGAFTNTIRSVFFSYILALFVSVTFGFIFSNYFEVVEATPLILFVEFFLMLSATLLLFGFFDVYHPPSIGAMLTYFIDRGFSDADVIIFVPVCVIFLLVTIKAYIYWRHPDKFKWQDLPKEFKRPVSAK